MNKRTIISSLVLITALIAGAGYAEAYNGYHNNDRHNANYRYQDCNEYHHYNNYAYNGYHQGKELTEKEINQLNELRLKHRQSMIPLFNELHAKHMELDALKYNPNTKPEQLSVLIQNINELETKIDTERENFRTKIEKDFGFEYDGEYGRHSPKYGRNYACDGYRHGNMHRNHF